VEVPVGTRETTRVTSTVTSRTTGVGPESLGVGRPRPDTDVGVGVGVAVADTATVAVGTGLSGRHETEGINKSITTKNKSAFLPSISSPHSFIFLTGSGKFSYPIVSLTVALYLSKSEAALSYLLPHY